MLRLQGSEEERERERYKRRMNTVLRMRSDYKRKKNAISKRWQQRERKSERDRKDEQREGGGRGGVGLGTRDDSGSRGVAAVGGTKG